jgi:hypothetical protein
MDEVQPLEQEVGTGQLLDGAPEPVQGFAVLLGRGGALLDLLGVLLGGLARLLGGGRERAKDPLLVGVGPGEVLESLGAIEGGGGVAVERA